MCGIAGIIGDVSNKKHLMQKMLKIQKHRGPDATHLWNNKTVCFGHNRLSIIDLNSIADQPMQSNNKRYTIVFNGEIYNYKELKLQLNEYNFKTKSDTEVLIALFEKKGKEMLNDLNGMFSFAIWDQLTEKLFVARDRFGVKPFYYSFRNNNLFFASEIKTIFEAGIEKLKNNKVWANYLVYATYGLPNETFWENINQLPGGHFFEFKLGDSKIIPVRWYDFVGNISKMSKLNEEDFKIKYLKFLKKSIQLRFRADVPIGFNISGGLDSSILLALVSLEFPNDKSIEAYTFYSNDILYDELPWVEKMISMTNKPLNKCLLDVVKVPEMISKISYYQDEPFGGFPTLAYHNIFETARKKQTIVLLDGQGMDEAWAGYDYYHNNSGFNIQGTKKSPVRPEVLSNRFYKYSKPEVYEKPFDNDLQNLQYRDLFYTKIPRALRFNDRISMMNGTELREPFLDYRLVELAFSQNQSMKLKDGISKWLLREIVKDLLVETIALAPKRALQTPQREWISNELVEYVESKVIEFSQNEFVKSEMIMKFWEEYKSGNTDNSFYVWQWINLNEILKT